MDNFLWGDYVGCSYFNLGDVDFNNFLNINKSEGVCEVCISLIINRKYKLIIVVIIVCDDDDYYMDCEFKGCILWGWIVGIYIWFCIMFFGCDVVSMRLL